MSTMQPHKYPFHKLPPLQTAATGGARELTEDEKALLQSSFVWMQASESRIPHPTSASYSELGFILLSLGHMQAGVKAISASHMRHWVNPHKARYEATGQAHGFYEILHHDFSLLEEVLSDCAEFSAGLVETGKP